MNSIERFMKTVAREEVDHPASWLGMPDALSLPGLYEYFGVSDLKELKQKIDDDLYPVEIPYKSPTSDAIYAAFDFQQSGDVDSHDRTLTEEGWFADKEDVASVDEFHWPEPERYISADACEDLFQSVPKDKAILGMAWSAHFQDTCAAFGMENALMNMIANPELYRAVDDKIVDFYLRANKIFYECARGRLHAVLIGNDMGSQRGLMLSPDMIRQFVLPGAKRLVEQAKEYGLKVLYHSCGAISEIIPDLFDIGVDVVHPIQALAAGMEPERLKEEFSGMGAFCGGVDTQDLLVNGSAGDVKNKVRFLRRLFPSGLIISPSHEAIMPDVSPANIEAMFEAAKEQD
ncbi:uroporphyrinogen decarboxylase family protein [Christensenellaceae bacterium OttesenSCG-928-K19]|nr:uroporphyrinogen decarboxylase family protein [Christensenellaceae bacterium OttesenSCG-928-K19]